MADSPSLSIIIPTRNAAALLPKLVACLRRQTFPPAEIIVIDSSSTDGTAELAAELGCQVAVIPQAEFNHGGTRNQGAQQAGGDVLVFMTQDALPVDDGYLAALVAPLCDGSAIATYARQVAYPDANPLEQFTRQFNYPPTPHTKTRDDLPRLGVKTYFFSDAASAVQREAFWAVGGYPDWVIVNEDMVLCARLLAAGHTVAYQAGARVYHSHAYGLLRIFRRYFDIGVFMTQARAELPGARSSGAGVRFALEQLRYLWRQRAFRWIPYALVEVPAKYVGFQLGRRSRWLPPGLRPWLSGQKTYWRPTHPSGPGP